MQEENSYLEQYDAGQPTDLYRGVAGKVRRYFDRYAQKHGQATRHCMFVPRIFALAGQKPKGKILEIGCGNGWAMAYRSDEVEYHALDMGSHYGEKLAELGVQLQVMNVENARLPYADGAFSMIMLNHIIEHIWSYDMFMKELTRVLAPDGILYVRTPDVQRVGWSFFDDYTHIKPYSRSGLSTMAAAYGLKTDQLLYSDMPRINLDIVTGGRLRRRLFSKRFGGNEIEAVFSKKAPSAA